MTRLPWAYREAPAHVPTGVHAGHTAADLGDDNEEIVVFLIGMRIHRWHKVRSWWQPFTSMPRMLRQLAEDPDLGLLGTRLFWSGRTIMAVQHWRSAEALGRFAKDPSLTHAPAWAEFNRRVASTGDVGIWHETYRVPVDRVESLYGNMPESGLGAAYGVTGRAGARRNRTHERMSSTQPEYVEA